MRQILTSRCLDIQLICSYRNLEARGLRKTLGDGEEDADEHELDMESSDGDEHQLRVEDMVVMMMTMMMIRSGGGCQKQGQVMMVMLLMTMMIDMKTEGMDVKNKALCSSM